MTVGQCRKNEKNFLYKKGHFLKSQNFQEIAILRHLEWFLEKMKESRPPLFFNAIGCVYSLRFIGTYSDYAERQK